MFENLKDFKIVADSSINVTDMDKVDFEAVPLKIITDEKEFIDDGSIDTKEMLEYLDAYDGKSTTSCPNVADWLKAFGDAQNVFVITISSSLSGSYQAALMAKDMYEEEHEGRRVHVFDSLATGPKMWLMAVRIKEDITAGMKFDEIVEDVEEYARRVCLMFSLESLKNLAKNGRITPVVAAVAGVFGIRLLGIATKQGIIDAIGKARGLKKAISGFVEQMDEHGFEGKRLDISHCENEKGAAMLADAVRQKYPDCRITITDCTGLCSYYAQRGGIIAGFEVIPDTKENTVPQTGKCFA